jgi:hypothetical protein
MFDTDDYLFLVTHPLAITGVYASGPLTDAMPDPREAFAEELMDGLQTDIPMASEEATLAERLYFVASLFKSLVYNL